MPEQPTHFFTHLAGVRVNYDRLTPDAYGTDGVNYDFHTPENFQPLLDACFEDLWEICPLGRAQLILSAGTYSDRASQHGTGRAMDVDGIVWPEKRFITRSFATQRAFYFGVEAVFRRHFDYVLNYLYNAAHHDHFHVDRGGRLGFGHSFTKTNFIQAMSRYVFDLPVTIDGDWGSETEEGLETMKAAVGVTGDLEVWENWSTFLEGLADRAFEVAAEQDAAPHGSLRRLADIVDTELAQCPQRKFALAQIDQLRRELASRPPPIKTAPAEFLEGEEAPAAKGRRKRAAEMPPSKSGRRLDRPFLPTGVVAAPREAGWHSRFGGQEWRFDARGVYLRNVGGGEQPLRTPGQPITCRAIWDLYAQQIRRASDRHGIPVELIMMTIATESAYWRPYNFTGPETFYWEPNVLVTDTEGEPYRGDYSAGPMQTLATTARWVIRSLDLEYDPFEAAPAIRPRPASAPDESPLYDPAINIDIGTAEIRIRLATSGIDPILVAACYNAGGLYESTRNAWHLRSTNDHLDRAARWYGDACAVLAGDARRARRMARGPVLPGGGGGEDDTAALAQRILATPAITLATVHPSGITDQANARQNIVDTAAGLPARRSSYGNAPGGTIALSPRLLGALLVLAEEFSFAISEFAGGEHSPNSRHYAGLAADIPVINGRHVSANHPDAQDFADRCAELGATEVRGPGDPGHSTHVHAAWPRPIS